jgi:RNase adapter protein RapZ
LYGTMTEKIVIITGLSGSGKSSVARTLEDRGYFCVDNIPVDLIPKLVELIDSRGGKKFPLAVVLDLRQRQFFPRYSDILATMEEMGASVDIVFVDARDEVIVRRYSETRRQHPLAEEGNLIDGISRERIELRSIREKANRVIDTSDMTVHRLREEVEKIFGSSIDGKLKIVVTSFGYGRGVPIESDLVMDVRFLPNPYFVEELKMKDGRDPAVNEWIMSKTVTKEFLEKLDDLLIFLLPLYIREGKRYFTVAVGCTGGRHRSVAVVEHVAELLRRQGYSGLEVRHREMPT